MKVPERYKEVLDFFEGLQVVGELSGENSVSYKRTKSKTSLQVLIKVSLGDCAGVYEKKKWFFKTSEFNKKTKYHFSFVLTFERNKDQIQIHASLPKFAHNSTLFVSASQMLKMYNNGLAYDLTKQGFSSAEIRSVTEMGYELTLTANENVSCEQIFDLYNTVYFLNTQSFNDEHIK